MPRWEYQAVPLALMDLRPKEWRDELKKRSVDGWDLVSTVKTPMGEMFLFNRREQEKAQPVFPREEVVEPSLGIAGIAEVIRLEEEAWRRK
jgi:hypothetical protein